MDKEGLVGIFRFCQKTSEQKSRKEIKSEGSIKVYEDSNYLIIVPITRAASIFYGKGTKWCTSAAQSTNFFRDYFLKQKATLFYVIHKKTGDKFVAVYHTPKRQFDLIDAEHNFMDESDFPFSSNFFLSLYNQYKEQIESERAKRSPKKRVFQDEPEIASPPRPIAGRPRRRRIVEI